MFRHISASTYQTGLLQSKAHRALTAFMSTTLSEYQLTVPQWSLLGILYDNKKMQPGHAARALGIRPPVATTLIRGLSKAGLVASQPHGTDNRAVVVTLTKLGADTVVGVEKRLCKDMRLFFGDVTAAEFKTYIRVLDKMSAKHNNTRL